MFLEFLVNNIASSVFSSALALLATLGCLKLFKVENPRLRYFLLFAPLLKGILVLLDTPIVSAFRPSTPIALLIRLPDPMGLITSPIIPDMESISTSEDLSAVVLTALLVSFAAVLLLRWAQLLSFRKKLASGPEVTEQSDPGLIQKVRELAKRIGVYPPRLVMTDAENPVPCTIGVIKPTIVVSQELIDAFARRDLDAILAHELAHVKRFDSITRWMAIVLKDIQFFNPAARLAYRHIEMEREVACDLMAARAIGAPPRFMADVVMEVVIFIRRKLGAEVELFEGRSEAAPADRFVSENKGEIPVAEFQPLVKRVEVLRRREMKFAKPVILSWIAAVLYFLVVVWLQIGISFRVWGFNAFVR